MIYNKPGEAKVSFILEKMVVPGSRNKTKWADKRRVTRCMTCKNKISKEFIGVPEDLNKFLVSATKIDCFCSKQCYQIWKLRE